MGKRCGVKLVTQDEIQALMIGRAREGRAVVRLKSGDSSLVRRLLKDHLLVVQLS